MSGLWHYIAEFDFIQLDIALQLTFASAYESGIMSCQNHMTMLFIEIIPAVKTNTETKRYKHCFIDNLCTGMATKTSNR